MMVMVTVMMVSVMLSAVLMLVMALVVHKYTPDPLYEFYSDLPE
jgi:hypothetical protein